MEKYWLFYALALVSEIIGTVSGFGSSILFVPIASLFFDFKEVLGITAVFHVFSNLSKLSLFRQGLDMHIVKNLGISAVAAVMIGALLTAYIPQAEVELLMSVMLIALSVYLLVYRETTMAATRQNLITGGLISGFLAGLIGTGGAIRGLVLAAFQLEKTVFVAASAMIDLGVDASRAMVYIYNGYFLREFIVMIPFLIGISFIGSWIGKLILQRTDERVFRVLVLVTILATSGFHVVKFFVG